MLLRYFAPLDCPTTKNVLFVRNEQGTSVPDRLVSTESSRLEALTNIMMQLKGLNNGSLQYLGPDLRGITSVRNVSASPTECQYSYTEN